MVSFILNIDFFNCNGHCMNTKAALLYHKIWCVDSWTDGECRRLLNTHGDRTEKCPDIAAIHVPHLSKALPRIYMTFLQNQTHNIKWKAFYNVISFQFRYNKCFVINLMHWKALSFVFIAFFVIFHYKYKKNSQIKTHTWKGKWLQLFMFKTRKVKGLRKIILFFLQIKINFLTQLPDFFSSFKHKHRILKVILLLK